MSILAMKRINSILSTSDDLRGMVAFLQIGTLRKYKYCVRQDSGMHQGAPEHVTAVVGPFNRTKPQEPLSGCRRTC
jgi:hypothetical protein